MKAKKTVIRVPPDLLEPRRRSLGVAPDLLEKASKYATRMIILVRKSLG